MSKVESWFRLVLIGIENESFLHKVEQVVFAKKKLISVCYRQSSIEISIDVDYILLRIDWEGCVLIKSEDLHWFISKAWWIGIDLKVDILESKFERLILVYCIRLCSKFFVKVSKSGGVNGPLLNFGFEIDWHRNLEVEHWNVYREVCILM